MDRLDKISRFFWLMSHNATCHLKTKTNWDLNHARHPRYISSLVFVSHAKHPRYTCSVWSYLPPQILLLFISATCNFFPKERENKREREIERDIEIKKKMQGDDNMKTGARDDMKIMALQAPVTAARPVRADLDDHISKPCQFSLYIYISLFFFIVLIKFVFMWTPRFKLLLNKICSHQPLLKGLNYLRKVTLIGNYFGCM